MDFFFFILLPHSEVNIACEHEWSNYFIVSIQSNNFLIFYVKHKHIQCVGDWRAIFNKLNEDAFKLNFYPSSHFGNSRTKIKYLTCSYMYKNCIVPSHCVILCVYRSLRNKYAKCNLHQKYSITNSYIVGMISQCISEVIRCCIWAIHKFKHGVNLQNIIPSRLVNIYYWYSLFAYFSLKFSFWYIVQERYLCR